MSAADDRMAVRTPSGYRSLPRRAALGMIATGRATAVTRPVRRAGAPVGGRWVTTDVPRGAAMNETTGEVTAPGESLPEAVSVPHPVDEVVTELVDEVDGDASANDVDDVAGVVEPRGNASRAAWVDYAASVGVVVLDDMTRNDIRDAVKSVRMSQPAREGGRLANPGDEPVTKVVTSAHPGIE